MIRPALLTLALACAAAFPLASSAARSGPAAWVLTKSGQQVEGTLAASSLTISVDGKPRSVSLREVLSVHIGDPASPRESGRIAADLAAVQGKDRPARDAAVAELTDLGLPALTPLLETCRDTDAHEPNPLGHLFARLVPGCADALDRSLDLLRLRGGEPLRGKVQAADLKLTTADGKERTVPASALRRLAIRRPFVERSFDLQALRHCSYVEFLDTGIAVTPASHLEETARGFIRLAFNEDGWTSDPDGLKKPGSPHYTTNLVDGFPFGAVIGRVGPAGPRWFAGRRLEKTAGERGRLYFAVNDNPHWQNNLGSYRMHVRVTDAYDLGDPE